MIYSSEVNDTQGNEASSKDEAINGKEQVGDSRKCLVLYWNNFGNNRLVKALLE